MHQSVGQLTVIGEQQQTLGLGVETSDVEKSLTGGDALADKIVETGATELVVHRGVDAARLVQREGDDLLVGDDADTVDADDVVLRVDTHALRGDDGAVDLDTTRLDELLTHPAGGDTRSGEDLLQAGLLRVRLGRLLLLVPLCPGLLRGLTVRHMLVAGGTRIGDVVLCVPDVFVAFRCAVSASGLAHGILKIFLMPRSRHGRGMFSCLADQCSRSPAVRTLRR